MSANGSARREAILAAAAELFSARGYPATGIDEIGEAVGITGPGVYRHFDSKSDVLAQVIRRAAQPLVDDVVGLLEGNDDPAAVLTGLVDALFDRVAADPAGFAVLTAERHHLDKRTLRSVDRLHRLHIGEWVNALQGVRPDLSDDEARTIVNGVFGLTLAVTTVRKSNVPHAAAVVRQMALDVLFEAG